MSIFWRGVTIWSLATIFYFFDNLLQVAPGAMKPQLSMTFGLSASELGTLASCYLWAYGLMQIPAGMMMDTIGPRKLLTIAGVSCALGSVLFSQAETFLIASVSRILIGFGASFAVIGCAKIASVWFHPRRFALFTGLMVAVGFSGSAFGLAAIHHVIGAYGWREAWMFAAFFGLIITIFMWFFIKDKPDLPVSEENKESSEKAPVIQSLKEVVTSSQDWLAAIYAGFMFVPTLAFASLWGTPYLVEAHGFSQEAAGYCTSLVFIGWVFGGPIYGWISDHIGRRNPPMYFANISTLIVTLIIIYGYNLSYAGISVCMFLLGFFSSGFIIAFVVVREKNRPENSGTAIGFINTMNTFSVALFQPLIGKILDLVSTNVIITDAGNIFSLADYQKALMIVPVSLVVSFFVLIPLRETYCKVKH